MCPASTTPGHSAKSKLCGVKAAHAMNTAAWRRRCGAYIEVARAGRVIAKAGAEEKLSHCVCSPADVAANKIRVHGFKGRRR